MKASDLAPHEQALYVIAHCPGAQGPDKFTLLVLSLYTDESESGPTLERLSLLTGVGVRAVQSHLLWWEPSGVVAVQGRGKYATAKFLGARAWLDHDEGEGDAQGDGSVG